MNGLNSLQCHFLRQTALMQTQVWTYGDYRTTGVVNTLTEQVLTETTLFTLIMSAKDFRGRLLEPVIARPRRPLSSRASTASCSIRFSLRTMMSGAARSSRRFRRLLRLMTRRYRSFRSEVAKTTHHPAEPADADLAAVPAERSGSSTLVCYQTERTLPAV
ncbi:Uncharacterised protein [Escherichia coli]|uniref:Uncharacterized protein n=1 Tax=Escherichia coli TaxID=562 RepID=A0A2X1MWX2_ECOLX|nr:Uncharacterised protein [Escherichia coli]